MYTLLIDGVPQKRKYFTLWGAILKGERINAKSVVVEETKEFQNYIYKTRYKVK